MFLCGFTLAPIAFCSNQHPFPAQEYISEEILDISANVFPVRHKL